MLMRRSQRLWIETGRGKLLLAVCEAEDLRRNVSNYHARVFGIFWKCARVGERLSPYVSICCVVMAVSCL